MTENENQDRPLIVDYVYAVISEQIGASAPARHLDMGAGWGHLIKRLRARFPDLKSWGLDYNPSHFPLAEVPIAHCDFSRDLIPHEDGMFDLITCTEVCEHLENFRHALREAARVLKPGGLLVVSTPNVLSLKARWAYFTRGFFTFFDPLPLKDDPKIYPGERHISPIGFFHLAHTLREAGLTDIRPHAGKAQKSSVFWAAVLGPCLRFVAERAHRRRMRRYGALPSEIERLARLNNSWPVLTARTLIVTARKAPDEAPA